MAETIKNGQLQMDGTTMDYIRFGSGEKHLIFLPGLGDGLRTVKGMALPMAAMYHAFAKDHTVWMFSRKNALSAGYSTEQRIQAAMRTLMQNKTCFVIAHRLSTIRSADNILVLDQGKVVEQGTHESLMAQKGFYCRLYQSQFDSVS